MKNPVRDRNHSANLRANIHKGKEFPLIKRKHDASLLHQSNIKVDFALEEPAERQVANDSLESVNAECLPQISGPKLSKSRFRLKSERPDGAECIGSPAHWLIKRAKGKEPKKLKTSRSFSKKPRPHQTNSSDNKENTSLFALNSKKNSPVMVKFEQNPEVLLAKKSKKLVLYQKIPSIIERKHNNTRNLQAEDWSKDSLLSYAADRNCTLIQAKSRARKFSNLNQCSKLNTEKTEIDEIIESNLDCSQADSRIGPTGKFSFRLKTKTNSSSDKQSNLAETIYFKNSVKSSRSVPNSPQRSRTMGSQSYSSSLKNCSKSQLDPFLHKSVKGKIFWKAGEIIAEGGASVVYKAFNEEEGYFFVVKRCLELQPEQQKAFQNEVDIYKKLKHKNIIKLIDSDLINDSFFIYLEYVAEGSLKTVLEKYSPLKEGVIRLYLRQILEGLEYLHEQKIVHRDIKSANILLNVNGTIKLTDFGCSRQYLVPRLSDINCLVESINPSNSEEFLESLKGTIPWMAPEVALQQKHGKKADVWSLGCTLIEMVTGKVPWGKLDNAYQAINKIGRSGQIPEIPTGISDDLRDFFLCCFKRDPKERPSVTQLKRHKFLEKTA